MQRWRGASVEVQMSRDIYRLFTSTLRNVRSHLRDGEETVVMHCPTSPEIASTIYDALLQVANATHASGMIADAGTMYLFLRDLMEQWDPQRQNPLFTYLWAMASGGLALCYRSSNDARALDVNRATVEALEQVATRTSDAGVLRYV